MGWSTTITTTETSYTDDQNKQPPDKAEMNTLWEHITTTVTTLVDKWHLTAETSPTTIILVTLAALAIAAYPPIWRIARQAATIIHELGHAIVGFLFGRKIQGIALHGDTSGLTTSSGKPYGLGMVASVLAGYPAPSLFGLATIWASTHHWPGAALTVFALLLLAALWLSSNAFGFLSTLVAAAAACALWWYGSAPVVTNTMLGVGIFMVVAGFRCCIDLYLAYRKGDGQTDAGQASHLTGLIPAIGWIGLFFAVAAWAIFEAATLIWASL